MFAAAIASYRKEFDIFVVGTVRSYVYSPAHITIYSRIWSWRRKRRKSSAFTYMRIPIYIIRLNYTFYCSMNYYYFLFFFPFFFLLLLLFVVDANKTTATTLATMRLWHRHCVRARVRVYVSILTAISDILSSKSLYWNWNRCCHLYPKKYMHFTTQYILWNMCNTSHDRNARYDMVN